MKLFENFTGSGYHRHLILGVLIAIALNFVLNLVADKGVSMTYPYLWAFLSFAFFFLSL